MKWEVIEARDVQAIPPALEDGVLYICERYGIAMHKCCCGCGEEVVTPLNPAEWSILRQDSKVSLVPSIGNWSLSCQSHYWIKGNRVIWTGRWTARKIQAVKVQDREAKIAYAAALNQEQEAAAAIGFFGRLWRTVRCWLDM